MVQKRQTAVIYVENNKISFYSKALPSIISLQLPAEAVADLEVVSAEKLATLIDNFFTSNNLKNQEFDSILVFAQNTTFDKDLAEGDSKFRYDENQKFLEIVPFEDTISNSYKLGKKTKIVAVNKSLYEDIRSNFEKNKAFVFLVVPMSVLIETYPNLSTNADLAFIASKIESIKEFSLIGFGGSSLEGEVKNSMGIKKKDRRLIILLAFMGVLFLILLFMVYSTFFSKPKPVKTMPIKNVVATPTPTPVIATDSATLDATPSSDIQ